MKNRYIIPEKELLNLSLEAGIAHFTVAAAIVRDGKLLLVRRVLHDFMGGHYELPGGHKDKNETLQESLIREVFEETGLTVASIEGMIDGFDYIEENNIGVRQFNFVVNVEEGDITLSPDEHDHFIWLEKKNLDTLELSPEMRRVVESYFLQNEKYSE